MHQPINTSPSPYRLRWSSAGLLVSCSERSDDDLDLHGNGLTRRAERILGVDPSARSNPLVLIPVLTGEEPFTLTYEVPVQTDVRSNSCELVLFDNGKRSDAYVLTRQTNGTYILDWGTTFASFGSHALRVGLQGPTHTIAYGPERLENITNLVQFDLDSTSFGSKACIYGKLRVPSADYSIEIYDTNTNLVKTIAGHTDRGLIDVVWDLRAASGQLRDDQEFQAKVYIRPIVAGTDNLAPSNGPPIIPPYPYSLIRVGKAGVGLRQ